MEKETAEGRIWIRWIVGAAVAAAVVFVLWYFRQTVVYILVSAVLAVLGRPLVERLARIRVGRAGMPRTAAATATLLVIWALFAVVLLLFVPMISHQLYRLSELDFHSVVQSVSEPVEAWQSRWSETLSLPANPLNLNEALTGIARRLLNTELLKSAFSSVVGVLFSSVIAFFSISFITFFFLKDEGLFYSMVTTLFPSRHRENVVHALDGATVLLSRYIKGVLTESLVLMVAVTAVMMLFGMKIGEAGFIGLVMGVMNVVPYAGPLIGGVISAFLGLATPIDGMTAGETMQLVIITLLVLKGCDDFILQPTLYSERVKAHPLEVFIVILMAGSMAGILGMLLAIPCYTVLRVFAKEFFSQFPLVRKLTEQI